MAHFAKLDQNNIVTQVITAGNEYEEIGEELYSEITGGVWKRTSYNTIGGVHLLGETPFRKNYAGIGYKYDSQRDAFISPKPFFSWILDEETCLWEAPVPYPNNGGKYRWDEIIKNWILIEE